MEKIIVGTKDGRVFFHTLLDKKEYYDLDSIVYAHPELTDYIEKNRIDLNMSLLRQKENFDITEKYQT